MALSSALRDRNERNDWTVLHELLASVLELLSVMRIEAWLIQGVPRYKLPDAIRIPRPGEREEPVMTVSPSQFARLSTAL